MPIWPKPEFHQTDGQRQSMKRLNRLHRSSSSHDFFGLIVRWGADDNIGPSMTIGPNSIKGVSMNRSLPFVKLAITVVVGVALVATPMAYAHADLDDLLGDWANAAASGDDSGASDAHASDDISLAPASATESLVSQTPADEQFTPADWAAPDLGASQTNVDELTQANSDSTKKTQETLTGRHHSSSGHSIVRSGIPSDLYNVATPSSNPYVGSSQGQCGCGGSPCGCDSEIVECGSGRCGCSGIGAGCSSCGDLVNRGDAHCIEGKSECRPHRRPNLPPPCTFLDLFRSRNSYTDVWAGYADETRLRVRNRSPHLDGTWKCRGCGALVEPTNNACGCGCGK